MESAFKCQGCMTDIIARQSLELMAEKPNTGMVIELARRTGYLSFYQKDVWKARAPIVFDTFEIDRENDTALLIESQVE